MKMTSKRHLAHIVWPHSATWKNLFSKTKILQRNKWVDLYLLYGNDCISVFSRLWNARYAACTTAACSWSARWFGWCLCSIKWGGVWGWGKALWFDIILFEPLLITLLLLLITFELQMTFSINIDLRWGDSFFKYDYITRDFIFHR